MEREKYMLKNRLQEIRQEKKEAIEEGDLEKERECTEREKECLEGYIQLAPHSVARLKSFLVFLKKEERKEKKLGNLEKVEAYRMQEEEITIRILSQRPYDRTMLQDLINRCKEQIRKAKEEQNPEKEETYTKLKQSLEQRKSEITNQRKQRAVQQENTIQEAITKVRTLIYEEQNVAYAAEEINRLLQGIGRENAEFLLTEFYFHTGFVQRAQKQLKKYKKDLSNLGKNLKLVNLGLQIANSTKSNRASWDEFWARKKELAQEKHSCKRVEEMEK